MHRPSHGQSGPDSIIRSPLYEGYYGRMFRLAPYEPDESELTREAEALHPRQPRAEDDKLPSGYTYLGQFLTHDLTFDPASRGVRRADPDRIRNFRSPFLDLDSVYGGGPDVQPSMYGGVGRSRYSFRIGRSRPLGARNRESDDLPRTEALLCNLKDGQRFETIDGRLVAAAPNRIIHWFGRKWARVEGACGVLSRDGAVVAANPRGIRLVGQTAVIADPRNDENIMISQLHLGFLKLHNLVLRDLCDGDESHATEATFDAARKLVTWHYQWVVLYDFLPRLVGKQLVKDSVALVNQGRPLRYYRWRRSPFMPIEFAAAAFRIGHAMVRDRYQLNEQLDGIPVFSGRAPESESESIREFEDLRGGRSLPARWDIDWNLMFGSDGDRARQPAMRISRALSRALRHIPDGDERALARRTLERGKNLGLPSGNAIARALGKTPVAATELPLWVYILEEASQKKAKSRFGKRLGPVGRVIVAETIIGLLAADPASFLRCDPNWEPTLGSKGGKLDMLALLRLANTYERERVVKPQSPNHEDSKSGKTSPAADKAEPVKPPLS